jgi:short-subunit dehydrogenase
MSLNQKITNWRNHRVWIVGASTGIGAALAEKLATKGARVAISARRKDALEAIAHKFVSGKVIAVPFDITDEPAWKASFDEVVQTWGGVDLIIFMAGDYKPMSGWSIDLATARSMIEINLMGFLNGLSHTVPALMKQGSGHISLVASVAGYRGLPRSLIYGPTKAALINLAEALYLDLHDKGLDISVVNPGFVRTPLTAQNEFKMPALIEPDEAADAMIEGYESGDFEIHFPKRFSRMLKALQVLPYRAYFKAVSKATEDAREAPANEHPESGVVAHEIAGAAAKRVKTKAK